MKRLGFTQRVDVVDAYQERRDALDQRWFALAEALGFCPLPFPNRWPVARALFDDPSLAGILLTGGNDIVALGGKAPERDETEEGILQEALARRIPVVGVCRGMEVLIHHFGGVLERVEGHVATRHRIVIHGQERQANSYHAWASRAVPSGFEALAWSEDGVLEAMRHREAPLLGIMWHPERENPFDKGDLNLLGDFLGDAGTRRSGVVWWVTGLSGAGKTTIGSLFTARLREAGRTVLFLDGDELREVFGSDLGHSSEDRRRSAMRNARLCRLLARQGTDVVCCTISMFQDCRDWNRAHLDRYVEIYLKAPLDVLKSRDHKQIYARHARGEVKNVYGLDLSWDEPLTPDITIENTGVRSPADIADELAQRASTITRGLQ